MVDVTDHHGCHDVVWSLDPQWDGADGDDGGILAVLPVADGETLLRGKLVVHHKVLAVVRDVECGAAVENPVRRILGIDGIDRDMMSCMAWLKTRQIVD